MNRNYSFSQRSNGFIKTLAEPLQIVCREGLIIANSRKLFCPDFAITRGLTSAEEQFKIFMKGRKSTGDGYIKIGKVFSNCDGYNDISDHQKTDKEGKALAFDYCAYIGKTNYDDGNMALIMTCFFEAGSDNKINLEYGGNYKSISDGSHVSLIVQ